MGWLAYVPLLTCTRVQIGLLQTMKELLLWKQAQESQGSTDLSVDRDVQSAKHIVPTCPTGLDTSFPPPVS